MYLSRLKLDPRHRDTRRWLSDCYQLHQVIMAGFPEVEDAAARARLGILFRQEPPSADRLAHVFVQSAEAPEWRLETNAVIAIDRPLNLDSIEARFAPGARFRFRLRANPTRRVHRRATLQPDLRELDTAGAWREPAEIPQQMRTGIVRRPQPETIEFGADRKLGPRVELTREEDRLAWLARRGRERDGFELRSVRVAPGVGDRGGDREAFSVRADPSGRLYGRKAGHASPITIITALFEGILEVTDADAFRRAFREGIGPGKAFGCGLLSLAPIDHM